MLKLLSLFSGIGAFEKALTNIGEPFEVVNYCEIDKYASKAYSLIHGIDERKNLIDVTKINTDLLPNDIDILTYGFPCQDISISGKMKGLIDENGELTRSGLFFEALRIIEDTQPKIAIAENVKALAGSRFKNEYAIVLNSLSEAGYINYAKILNAKNYGIPQNRERVFIISIRKDIAHGFEFPQPFELKKRLNDLLETDVDEKYYLSREISNNLIESNIEHKNTNALIMEGLLNTKGQEITRRVYNPEGIAPTLNTMQGGNRQPKILCAASRGRGENNAQHLEIRKDDCTNSLTTVQKDNLIIEFKLPIRNLTPKECFRLMGFDDRDIDILIDNKISNSQLYKMAGNSIVVDVLEEIFVELLNQYENIFPIGG